MKLKNGDEIEVGGERYRVIDDTLFVIREGKPPVLFEHHEEPQIPLDPALRTFYERKGYDVCPGCGGERSAQGLTGCGQWHYGTYCMV